VGADGQPQPGASGGAFAPGGRIRSMVGDEPIAPGVRDARAGKDGAVLALPRRFHAEALARGELGPGIASCVAGAVPLPRAGLEEAAAAEAAAEGAGKKKA
jgi:hypothetical protein